jgi:hypothetical protein
VLNGVSVKRLHFGRQPELIKGEWRYLNPRGREDPVGSTGMFEDAIRLCSTVFAASGVGGRTIRSGLDQSAVSQNSRCRAIKRNADLLRPLIRYWLISVATSRISGAAASFTHGANMTLSRKRQNGSPNGIRTRASTLRG